VDEADACDDDDDDDGEGRRGGGGWGTKRLTSSTTSSLHRTVSNTVTNCRSVSMWKAAILSVPIVKGPATTNTFSSSN